MNTTTDAWLERWRHANDELALPRERFREIVFRDNNGQAGLFTFAVTSPNECHVGQFGATTLFAYFFQKVLMLTFRRDDHKQITIMTRGDDTTGKHLYVQYIDAEIDEAKEMLEDVNSRWTGAEQMIPSPEFWQR